MIIKVSLLYLFQNFIITIVMVRVDCKKPRFDNDNENSIMFRDTNIVGNRRKRSYSNGSRERR